MPADPAATVTPPSDFEVLANSQEFAEFTAIIQQLTGLDMALNNPGVTKIHKSSTHGRGNPLCLLIRGQTEGQARCHACDRRFQKRAAALGRPLRYVCHAGFIDMAIPIIVQDRHVATISCGQILPAPPSEAGARRLLRRLSWLPVPPNRLRRAYFAAPYLTREAIDSVMRLQSLFTHHLCESARQHRELAARLERVEIRTARAYIEQHFRNGQLQLGEVARRAGLSPAHFCIVFHQTTGLHFSRFIQLRRVEEARRLLVNTRNSISTICHDCGFNSLTHFNRVFRRSERCSPRQFRKRRH